MLVGLDRNRCQTQARSVRFLVRHHSRYQYDVPVELGLHTLRLSPRAQGASVLSRQLVVEPKPVRQWDEVDEWGNTVTRVTFGGATTHLDVTSQCEVETYNQAPVPVGLPPLPWVAVPPPGLDADVVAFAQEVAAGVGHTTHAFLDQLCERIYQRTARHQRLEGDAQTPRQTLLSGSGACRDVAVLFLEACRAMGLQGYFVSGYQARASTTLTQRQLHAWAEIAVANGLRCAWDPTHGTKVGSEHLTLCAAPNQRDTMPIEGGFTFVGGTVNSTLSFEVDISAGS